MCNFEIIKKIFTSVLAVSFPFIIYFTYGSLESISQSWETGLQPLFIFTNALVSYFFFDLSKWRIPAILLLLLTVFSVESWFTLHNVLAVMFFITCGISMLSLKKFRFYSLIYLTSLFFLLLGGFFWMETWAIICLVTYHMHLMFYTLNLSRTNSNCF
jgi:hypothetical protein